MYKEIVHPFGQLSLMMAFFRSISKNLTIEPELHTLSKDVSTDAESTSKGNMSYAELKRLDERRSLFEKMRGNSYLEIMHVFRNVGSTAFPQIVTDFNFWSSTFLYWFIRYRCNADLNVLPSFDSTALGFGASLIIFSLVYYLTHCYSRFITIFDSAKSAQGRIRDVLQITKCLLPDQVVWRLYRYVNAAHILSYVGLQITYTEDNLFRPLNEKYMLLSPDEVYCIEQVGYAGGTAYSRVLGWAIHDICIERRKGNLTDQEHGKLLDEILTLRGKLGTMFKIASQPIPFSYVILMKVAIGFYIPLFAASLAISYPSNAKNTFFDIDSIFEYLTMMAFIVLTLGLKWLAHRLQDPFGTDPEDLPILSFVLAALDGEAQMLGYDRPSPCGEDEERAMCDRRGQNFNCSLAVQRDRL